MDRVVRQILLEAGPTIMGTGLIGVLLGVALESIKTTLEALPAMFLIVPVVMDLSGDVGSIIGSRLTTALGLGEVPRLLSREFAKKMLAEFAAVYSATLVTFVGLGGVSTLAVAYLMGLRSLSYPTLAGLLGVTCLLTAPLVAVISISAGAVTYVRGLDPDNFTIPIEATLADAAALLSLMAAVRIMGLI
ncbi:MAG: magnesium transporter [Candidatus Bathyarchaeia archaeon]